MPVDLNEIDGRFKIPLRAHAEGCHLVLVVSAIVLMTSTTVTHLTCNMDDLTLR